MWRNYLAILIFSIYFNGIICRIRQSLAEIALAQEVVSIKNYVFWPNATVPFYINSEHFDTEQTLAILTALSMFAFKTCLKFAPVMAPPQSNEHVMLFENPNGIRRCVLDTIGHSVYEPHRVVIGYDCLQNPQLDMMIMRSLGFPFEHNKPNRGVYVDILNENIEPGHTDLFTKDVIQAIELSALPYDINSVMHFGDRDYSKNGHRTIMFKNPAVAQNRVGLNTMDMRKIDVVYGPECRTRDRQEKLDLCQSYPGVARRKREADKAPIEVEKTGNKTKETDKERQDRATEQEGVSNITEVSNDSIDNKEVRENKEKDDIQIDVTKNLRINRNITPPPLENELYDELGIVDGLQEIIDNVFKVSKLALNNVREKYCLNNTNKPSVRSSNDTKVKLGTDILYINGIVNLVTDHVKDVVNHAKENLTEFCLEPDVVERYSRFGCSHDDGSGRCPHKYRSTKSGAVRYSTQHRPTFFASTNYAFEKKHIFDNSRGLRSGLRRKREVEQEAVTDKMERLGDNDDDKRNVTESKDKNDNKNEEKVKDSDDRAGKNKGENETSGPVVVIKDVELSKKNENATGDTDLRGSEDQKEIKVNTVDDKLDSMDGPKKNNRFEVNRRRHMQYRTEDDSSISVELVKPKMYQKTDLEDERDPKQNIKRIEKEREEKTKLRNRLELKKQRNLEYEEKFKKHVPPYSNELELNLREGITKRSHKIRPTEKVKTIPDDETPQKQKKKRKYKGLKLALGDKNDENQEPRIDEKEYVLESSVRDEYKKYKKPDREDREDIKLKQSDERTYKKQKDVRNEERYEKNIDSNHETEDDILKDKESDIEEAEYKKPKRSKLKEDKQSESEEHEIIKEKPKEKPQERLKQKPKKTKAKKIEKYSGSESEEVTKKENKIKEERVQSGDEEKSDRQTPDQSSSKEISRTNLPRLVKLTKANEEFYKDRRWPGGEVRYVIKEDTTYNTDGLRTRIEEVNDILKSKTCVYLKELTEDQATEYEDYLVIDNSPDYVTGRVGGRQKFGSVELFRGDQHRQHTAMMVMAWLGFYFEVSRHDRDKYVRVHDRHVRPDKLHHFEKIRSDATLNLPYDFESATHPAWQYWRQIGRKGISAVATYKHKDPDGKIMKSMGQNENLLSNIDIIKINSVYGLSCKRQDRAKHPKAGKRKRDTSSSSSSSESSH